MFEFKKLCNESEKLNPVERGALLLEKSVAVVNGLHELNLPVDPVGTLVSFIMGSVVSDGAFNEKDYLYIYPSLVKAFGNDDGNFLSPFSVAGYPVISGETAEFLDHNSKRHLASTEVKLIISSDEIDENEQKVYANAIRNYYRTEYKETRRELHKNFIQTIVMTVIAAVVFAVAVTLGTTTQTSDVVLNMLDVFAWVFMWEAVDIFFFQRPVLKRRQKKNIGFINADITFTAGDRNLA